MWPFSSSETLAESGLLKNSIDYHSHLLPGVDDGVQSMDETLEILHNFEKQGVAQLWLTPHVMEDIPNTTERLKARFSELQAAYKGGVELHLAAEYMLDTLFEQRLYEKDFLTLDGDTVLVETSTWTPPYDLMQKLQELQKSGFYPLLAHPERYRYMDKEDYEELFRMGVRFQLNLPSVIGYYGNTAQQKSSWLLSKEMYSAVGTDCHRVKALGEPYRQDLLSKSDLKNLQKIL